MFQKWCWARHIDLADERARVICVQQAGLQSARCGLTLLLCWRRVGAVELPDIHLGN